MTRTKKATPSRAERARGRLKRQVVRTSEDVKESGRKGLVASEIDFLGRRWLLRSFRTTKTTRDMRKRRSINEKTTRCGQGERKTKESHSPTPAPFGGDQAR
ncbi:hypothetical protein M5K25_000538 [Dendrobium thyrsiflorum]|uniref:Uncharacterized protein n=1 Tax=Dendrobium thyrsiflorum TaxID=117978 RepID=A0ABD0W7R2_DENTH